MIGTPSNVAHYPDTESAEQLFIRENGLDSWVRFACNLAEKIFCLSGGIVVQKEEDPEFSDEWICLHIVARGSEDAVLAAYDTFTREMVRAVPPEAGRKIRLSLGVV